MHSIGISICKDNNLTVTNLLHSEVITNSSTNDAVADSSADSAGDSRANTARD